MPNLLQTGAGSPTGICVYEGDLLPKIFQGQIIHCDAGPSIVRAYPVKPSGAGYTATTVNILDGAKRDKWFRPSDVKVAPDGSLIVADWYDPGVGGHRMGDLDRGRLFRITPRGHKGYKVPKSDFKTAKGLVVALKNPNNSVRHIAFTELKTRKEAAPILLKLLEDGSPHHRARALWLLAQNKGIRVPLLLKAAVDRDENIRALSIRISRQLKLNTLISIRNKADDNSPVVRRECLIALRHHKSPEAPALWAYLANAHDGKDRWYLEALGLAADRQENKFFDAWLKTSPKLNTPAARDIIWRNRGTHATKYLADIILDKTTPEADKPRYLRALDFIPKSKEKDQALARIALGL
jgi:hypothetical protein